MGVDYNVKKYIDVPLDKYGKVFGLHAFNLVTDGTGPDEMARYSNY